jgi:hypothetical protein
MRERYHAYPAIGAGVEPRGSPPVQNLRLRKVCEACPSAPAVEPLARGDMVLTTAR